MQPGLTGHYVPIPTAGEPCRAFVPKPLPPNPPLVWDTELLDLHAQATPTLGRLDGLAAIRPKTGLFLYSYIRKEAALSSQIEGTQSSLSELLLFVSAAVPGVPLDDVLEVSNYVAATTRAANSALRAHAYLKRDPLASIARISKETGLTHPTVTSAVGPLERLGIVRPASPAKYGRLYAYHRYLKILSEGTEPLRGNPAPNTLSTPPCQRRKPDPANRPT